MSIAVLRSCVRRCIAAGLSKAELPLDASVERERCAAWFALRDAVAHGAGDGFAALGRVTRADALVARAVESALARRRARLESSLRGSDAANDVADGTGRRAAR